MACFAEFIPHSSEMAKYVIENNAVSTNFIPIIHSYIYLELTFNP